MNDDLKFRIWNGSKMVFGPTDDNPNPSWVLASAPMFEFPVQQYTGLKDKNNKEIYEGDIVKTIYAGDTSFGDVIYTKAVGAYRIRCGTQLLPIVTYRVVDGKPVGLITVAEAIIGNIFENSDLLEPKTSAVKVTVKEPDLYYVDIDRRKDEGSRLGTYTSREKAIIAMTDYIEKHYGSSGIDRCLKQFGGNLAEGEFYSEEETITVVKTNLL